MFARGGPTFFELARQALSSTERGYDLLAPKFDKTPFRTPDLILRGMVPILEQLGPVATAVDVCCGTGAATEAIFPYVTERIVGIDMSRGMIEQAEKNLTPANGPPATEFVQANVLTMDVAALGRPFDLAVTFGANGHILPKDERQFVRQVAAMLKPGGRFLFVTGYAPPIYSPAYLIPAGFNLAMRLRNLIIRPPFIMYYLTFLLPEVKTLLESEGFAVKEHLGLFGPYLKSLRLIEAVKS